MKKKTIRESGTPTDPKTLRAAPERVRIGESRLALRCALLRDFMPGTNLRSGLIAVVTLRDDGGRPIPSELRVVYLWVIHGNEVWASTFSDEPRPASIPSERQKVARGGPAWPPGAVVEAVVKLADAGGKTYLLRARGQRIMRTM